MLKAIKKMMVGMFLTVTVLLGGCTLLGGGDPAVGTNTPQNSIFSVDDAIIKGLQRVQSNLHLAVLNKDLPADDPAIRCVDTIVGLPCNAATGENCKKEYDNNGLLAKGSLIYIQANGARRQAIGKSCNEVVGGLMIEGMKSSPMGGALR